MGGKWDLEFLCSHAGPLLSHSTENGNSSIDSGRSGGTVTQHASLDSHALSLSLILPGFLCRARWETWTWQILTNILPSTMTTGYHCGNQSLGAVNISPATNPGRSSISAMVTEIRSNIIGVRRIWILSPWRWGCSASCDEIEIFQQRRILLNNRIRGLERWCSAAPITLILRDTIVIFRPRRCLLTDLSMSRRIHSCLCSCILQRC